MRKSILAIAIFFLVIGISNAQANDNSKRYEDKFELTKDLLNAVQNRNIEKIKSIVQSITMPYDLFQKQAQNTNKISTSEISKKSWYSRDSFYYNNFAPNFYVENFIESILNDTDNEKDLGNKIYLVFNKIKNKKNEVEQQNNFEILFDNKDYIKVIRLNEITNIDNQIFTKSKATFQSYLKANISLDLLNKPTSHFEVYTLEDNNLKLYEKNNIIFESEVLTQGNIKAISSENEEIFESVEEMPTYSGGTQKLLLYLKENLHYPKAAQKNKVEGIVVIRFIIDKNGSIFSPVIVKDATNGFCTEEAIRLVRNMPKWWPGKQDEKAVKVYYTLAIPFSLK